MILAHAVIAQHVARDPVLFHHMQACVYSAWDKDEAAAWFIEDIENIGHTHTPCGYRISKTAIRQVMRLIT